MEETLFRKAISSDFIAVQKLLQTANLSVLDVDFSIQQFIVAEYCNELIGCVAIETFTNVALLRSLSVTESTRGKGIGRSIISKAITLARDQHIDELFLLTTTAPVFFEKQKWIYINRADVPESIQQSSQYADICPASAHCMYYRVANDEVNIAIASYVDGYNCGQSVLGAFSPLFGVDAEVAHKMNSFTAAGLGFKGQLCGAVLAAYQLIGLKYGRVLPEDELSKELVYAAMKQFDELFTSRYGSLQCSVLLDQRVDTESGLAILIEDEAFSKICPQIVKKASEIINIIIK